MAKCILKRLENEGMDKPAAFLRKKYTQELPKRKKLLVSTLASKSNILED